MRKRDLKLISSYTVSALQGVWRQKKARRGITSPASEVDVGKEKPAPLGQIHRVGQPKEMDAPARERSGADVAQMRSISAASENTPRGRATEAAAHHSEGVAGGLVRDLK